MNVKRFDAFLLVLLMQTLVSNGLCLLALHVPLNTLVEGVEVRMLTGTATLLYLPQLELHRSYCWGHTAVVSALFCVVFQRGIPIIIVSRAEEMAVAPPGPQHM